MLKGALDFIHRNLGTIVSGSYVGGLLAGKLGSLVGTLFGVTLSMYVEYRERQVDMVEIVLVTLVHNRKHLLGYALQSAVNQTLKKDNWVHLVIDNASTDGAYKIAETFAKKYNHIHVERMPENMGQQRAYNYVLNEWLPEHYPEAEIMVVLDSDDMLAPVALEEVKKMFDAHSKIGQTYSGFNIIDGKGRLKHKNHPKAKLVDNQFSEVGQRLLRKIFLKQNPIGHLRAFRISCLRDIGGFNTDYQYSTDYNVAGRMLQKYPVVKINKVLYNWRQHDTQVERQHSPQQTKDWQDMQKEFLKLFTEKGLV